MVKVTIYTETKRIRRYPTKHADIGYDCCIWHCSHCKHNLELPQQQQIHYCPFCGAKIIKKIGGKTKTKLPVCNQ